MYTFRSRVRYSETDPSGRLRIDALMDYLQDCSAFQSEDLDLGIQWLKDQDMGWIVNYWQIDISSLPRLGDEIVIGTSPYAFKGFMGLRNFMIATPEGERIVQANSVWSLFNMKKQFPVRVLDIMKERYQLFPKFDMEYTPRKIAVPEEAGESLADIYVGENMLDSNDHVNNVQYVRAAASFLPEGVQITRLRVEYLQQAHLGDTIHPHIFRTESGAVITLDDDGGKPYCVTELQGSGRGEQAKK